MKIRKYIVPVIYLAVVLLLLFWLMGLFTPKDDVTYSQIVELFQAEQVKEFKVTGDKITLTLHTPFNDKTEVSGTLADPEGFRSDLWPLLQEQTQKGVLTTYNFVAEKALSPYDFIFPIIISGVVLILVWGIFAGKANHNNPLDSFGKARTVYGQTGKKVTFDDVAGLNEEKAELQEIVDFLRDPEKFTAIGARIPHGLLLAGPPGTGKTLMARAAAGEADVQFLSISASDFMEMYVGVGASRVRDLFAQAKRIAPAIIFIDEIDAVGRKRGSGLGGGHDEREQTLNQLLVEMDGFNNNEGVIVLAATNRSDILDPALLRPGRFDRQIYVGAPDAKGREDILRVHAKGKKLDGDVDLKVVALATVGCTGADLSNIMNEAAIMAARNNRPVLTMQDLNDAMMKILAGPEKRSRVKKKKDLQITAIHEAGHAVAMYSLPTHDPVHQISIVPRGRALGLTWTLPTQDNDHLTKNDMFEQIVGLLGGRVAEALYLNDISTGASNDIERASKIARDMAAKFGMCENLGTVSYDHGEEVFLGRDFEKTKGYSEKVAATIDDAVKQIIDSAYQRCEDILKRDADKMRQVVEFLMEHETMTGQQFADCMEGRPIRLSGETTLFDAFKETES